MMNYLEIEKVIGREIIDSRGNPTVEAEVILADGTVGRGAAPSGASTGEFEALELRDGDKSRYQGKGVLKAVENINTTINDVLKGMDASDIYAVDKAMIEADGTKDKSNLGANAILAVSIASARAAAISLDIPLYRFLGGISGNRLPVPMMNILNGGAHAANTVDVQEFMIMPYGAKSFKQGLRWCSEVFHELKKVLSEMGNTTAVGDEGGFAPNLETDEKALEVIMSAIGRAGYKAGEDFKIAIDAASSEWVQDDGTYLLPKSGIKKTASELVEYWQTLCEKYPIFSIEDALGEDDWDGWKILTDKLGDKIQLEAELKALMAQKAFESRIVAGAPFAMVLLMRVTAPSYMRVMYETSSGLVITSISLLLIACAFLFAYFGDMAAYFTGVFFGRHKMVPRLSPKKTWEGAVGGLLGSVVVGLLLFAFEQLAGIGRTNLPLWGYLLLGLFCGVAEQAGDLTASLIKRFCGIKDYGNLFPGHGGMMDRMDSVLFTTIVIYGYCLLAELL